MKRPLHWSVKGSIGVIAGICAVGTGMLAAATVISTPTSLLLLLAGGFVVNYLSPLIYRWLSAWFLAADLKNSDNQTNYLMKVLKSNRDLDAVDSVHARNLSLANNFWLGLASLTISLAFAVGVYYLASLIPAAALLYSLAALMFGSLAIITAMNFYGGMTDIWRSISEPSTETISHPKKLFLFFCALSSVAAGLLAGAITRQGVQTTIPNLFPALAMTAGPLGWLVLGTMILAVFSLTGYEIFKMMKGDELSKKLSMLGSFFSPKRYLSDLKTEWKTINQSIAQKKKDLLACDNDAQKTQICREMDELYRQKDSVYHRYNMYQQKGFFALYAVVTAVVFTLSLGGMLMHLARNYQSFSEMLPRVLGVSARVSTAIATGVMYLAMLSESIFTGSIVTSTMHEEALLGTQTKQYDTQLQSQQKVREQAKGYFYQTSRGMHFIYETLLGLFGAAGHHAKPAPAPAGVGAFHVDAGGGKTGLAFADYKPTANMFSLGMGVRAGLERHEMEMPALHFMYKRETAGISNVATRSAVEQDLPPLISKSKLQKTG